MQNYITKCNKNNFLNSDSSKYYNFQQKITPDNFNLIDVKKLDHHCKKVAIVYNPNAGKRIDRKGALREKLQANHIQFTIFETTGVSDAMKFILDLDIDQYSSIMAVGGDGTCHEVLNGMMRRSDKKKVPICFIPNGTGNDLCGSLNLDEFEEGLDYFLRGDLIKIDIFKALLDFDSEE